MTTTLPRASTVLRSLVVALLAAALLIVCLAGCKPAPVPKTIDVVGDSILVQSRWGRGAEWLTDGKGAPAGSDVHVDAWLGFKFEDVQDRLTERVLTGRPEILVIALGTNNASVAWNGPGWTAEDERAFDTLLGTPHPDACVVVVLPAAGKTAPMNYRLEAHEARAYMAKTAKTRPNTVTVDWGPPSGATYGTYLLDPDGVHLRPADKSKGLDGIDPAAASAYGATIWEGVSRCP